MKKKKIAIFVAQKREIKIFIKKESIKLLNDNNFTFIYGGGSIGLMGVVFDAIKSYNGKITGIIPKNIK